MVGLKLKLYTEQNTQWPQRGRIILCQETATSVVVYQSYKPSIGHYAASHQKFTGCPDFSLTRMSWIKTNFLWMMYRNGWGTKKDQEVVLAIHLEKSAFHEMLRLAVPSSFKPTDPFESKEAYEKAKLASEVRLQWDPDHDPFGKPVVRRAIQLGIRGEFLQRFACGEVIERIEDITEFVKEQREFVNANRLEELIIPEENVYVIEDESIRRQVNVDN